MLLSVLSVVDNLNECLLSASVLEHRGGLFIC